MDARLIPACISLNLIVIGMWIMVRFTFNFFVTTALEASVTHS